MVVLLRETWKPGKDKLVVVENIEFIWGKKNDFRALGHSSGIFQ